MEDGTKPASCNHHVSVAGGPKAGITAIGQWQAVLVIGLASVSERFQDDLNGSTVVWCVHVPQAYLGHSGKGQNSSTCKQLATV